jgi:hypothetical protein
MKNWYKHLISTFEIYGHRLIVVWVWGKDCTSFRVPALILDCMTHHFLKCTPGQECRSTTRVSRQWKKVNSSTCCMLLCIHNISIQPAVWLHFLPHLTTRVLEAADDVSNNHLAWTWSPSIVSQN